MTDNITISRAVVQQALDAMSLAYEGKCRLDTIPNATDALRAALEQPVTGNTVSVPTGWKLVPVEPSKEMCVAGATTAVKHDEPYFIYQSMLEAAPQPPAMEQSQGEQETDWKGMYLKEKRRAEMWIAKYENDIGKLEVAVPVAEQPQGEQEPVSWKWCYEDGELSDISFESRAECERRFTGYKGKSAPLYIHPQPPREPLTDEQIDGIIRDLDPPWLDTPTGFEEEFCHAIERAHGIGGEA